MLLPHRETSAGRRLAAEAASLSLQECPFAACDSDDRLGATTADRIGSPAPCAVAVA
jgi:hypothetical protein